MSRANSLAIRNAALLPGVAGQRKRLAFNAYTVAFICPLEVELSAARYMLDEEHERLSPVAGDTNQYILGEISGHNIAIACLPAGYHGKVSAATVSRNMARTYPSIELRFLIGIGGGVPRDGVDVRLGDVVIGTPSSTNGGVVQYDLGNQTTTGFLQKGFLCPPPSNLLTTLQIIRSNHKTRANMIPKFIAEMTEKLPSLAGYKRPSQNSDILFQSNYEHEPDRRTCEDCDKSKSIARSQRTVPHQPVIHYGTIASGDRVMKDGKERDYISKSCEDAICFEMEAAGLMNDFRCIVIRGISDYADSHKNDIWQPYAAAAAAAFAKEILLSHLPGMHMNKFP
jgi:nucleoside phosphorylase